MNTSSLLTLLVDIIVAGLIFSLFWWLIGYAGLPQPFDKVARVLLALVAVIFLVALLLSLTGHPFTLHL